MMTILIVLAAAAQAYLLGSIDTGILVSKYLYQMMFATTAAVPPA